MNAFFMELNVQTVGVRSTRIYDLSQEPELAAKIRRAKEEKKYMIHFGLSFSLFFPY